MSSIEFLFQWMIDENKRKLKDRQVLGPCLRTEKTGENKGDSDTFIVGGLEKESGEIEDHRKTWDQLDHSSVKIS